MAAAAAAAGRVAFTRIYVDVRWHKTQLSDLARRLLPRSRHITRRCHLEKLYDPVYYGITPPYLICMRRHVFVLMRVTFFAHSLVETHTSPHTIRCYPRSAIRGFRDGYNWLFSVSHRNYGCTVVRI
jgi:hypothetical protein